MAEDLELTGTTVGDISYVVVYYDVNTNNLYNANGQLYGNSTFATTLNNEFILELHYVQDISTSDNPEEWVVWDGLKDMTVSSTLAFDDNYVHAVEGSVVADAVEGDTSISVDVSNINKDTLSTTGVLIINPFSTGSDRIEIEYSSFAVVSGSTFTFTLDDVAGLPSAVASGSSVRVADPLYLFVDSNSIYESNIPNRYEAGVFKIPMSIMSRKLLKALDYSGASGVSGTMEHKIYIKKNMLSGISVSNVTYSRNNDEDSVATYDGTPFLFCGWTNNNTTYWTKGNDVQNGDALYSVSDGVATLTDPTATVIYSSDLALFRTFAFPFIVKNLIDYGTSFNLPVDDVNWTKEYIISIVKNNIPAGIVNNDPDHLTIENGGISVNTYDSNLTSAVSDTDKKKLPTVSAIQMYVGDLASSNSSYVSSYVNSSNVIPQSAVVNLSSSLNAKQDNIIAGDLIDVNGATVNRKRIMPIVSSGGMSTIVKNSKTYYVLEPGNAYQLNAVNNDLYLTGTSSCGANQWGIEGHIELFVAVVGRLHTDTNVVLADALEPDSINNCVIRFHNGRAIIGVEDHLAGNIVTINATGTTVGTLKYYLQLAPTAEIETQYIAVDAQLNGQTLNMDNAVTNGEKHIVGNGYTQTILSGGISCTSKTTFSNLGMNGFSVLGGTATLGDVFIDAGSTVSVNGGNLAIEKVTGSGGTIDLGGTNVTVSSGATASAAGCVFSGGSATTGGCFNVAGGANIVLSGATISNNSASTTGGGMDVIGNATLVDCTVIDNYATALNRGPDIYTRGPNTNVSLRDCTVGGVALGRGGITVAGTCVINIVRAGTGGGSGTVTLTSGATLDLTGNTNSTPIVPGGCIVIQDNVQIYPSAGLVSAVQISGGTFAQITNGGILITPFTASANSVISGNATVSGTMTGGNYTLVGLNLVAPADPDNGVVSGDATTNITFSGCTIGTNGTWGLLQGNGQFTFSDCIINNKARVGNYPSHYLHFAGSNTLNSYIDFGSTRYGVVVISGGAVLDLTGNTNSTPIVPGGGITISSGGISIIDSAGSTHEFQDLAITGSTINNLGQILGATVSIPAAGAGVGPWIVSTTLGSSTVSATAEAQELVIEGGLVSIQEL